MTGSVYSTWRAQAGFACNFNDRYSSIKQKSSKRRRRIALLLGLGPISILFRLVPIVLFILLSSEFIFGQRPESGGDISEFVSYHMSRSVATNGNFQVRMIIFAALAAVSFFSLLKDASRIAREYRTKVEVKVPSVHEFWQTRKFKRSNFILILRPFGSDGNLFLREKKSFWAHMLSPSSASITIEQIIRAQAATAGSLETISVVDPNIDELAPGPKYIKCGENWKTEVSQLIAAATAVVILLPAGEKVTPSLSFEFAECFRWGDTQKTAVVLPPSGQQKHLHLPQILDELSSHYPVRDELASMQIDPNKLIVLLPGFSTLFFFEKFWFFPFSLLQRTDASSYKKFFAAWFLSLQKGYRLGPEDL